MARSTTTQEIAQVANTMGVDIFKGTDWEQEVVVRHLLRDRGVRMDNLNEVARLLGRASVQLDEEQDGNYTVPEKISRAVEIA